MLFIVITLALTTWRKGQHLVFWVGITLQLLWIVAAVIASTGKAEALGAA